ncbi:MAG: methionyl-tRNA formyltransferase [Pseudomonadota bacterium]
MAAQTRTLTSIAVVTAFADIAAGKPSPFFPLACAFALMSAPLRIAFLGTAAFAQPCLTALHKSAHEITRVYTKPPQPAGRGRALRASVIDSTAQDLGLPLSHAGRGDALDRVDLADCDLAVVVAFGVLLPPGCLSAPRLGWCLNVHPSLLPHWRGPAPIERALLAGESHTGVSLIRLTDTQDAGPIICQQRRAIESTMTGPALHDILAQESAPMLLDALARIKALTFTEQDHAAATDAPKITSADRRLTWKDATQADRIIRTFTPRAWFMHGTERLCAVDAHMIENTSTHRVPGTVLDDALTVACARGSIQLKALQRPGRAPMTAAAFLRGYRLPPGTVLS